MVTYNSIEEARENFKNDKFDFANSVLEIIDNKDVREYISKEQLEFVFQHHRCCILAFNPIYSKRIYGASIYAGYN